MKNKRLFATIVLLSCKTLWSDLAPTTYPTTCDGYTLSPKEDNDIRMRSEEVDMYCAEPLWRVVGKFEMANETDKPINLFVGFPVGPFEPAAAGAV
jgi:hypothetical protein